MCIWVWVQLCGRLVWTCPWTLCDLLGAHKHTHTHSDYKSKSPPTTKLIKTSDCTFIYFFVPGSCIKVRIKKSTQAASVCVDALVCDAWEGVARDNRPVEKWSVLTNISRAWGKGLFDLLTGAHWETGETPPPSVLVLMCPHSHTRLDFNCSFIPDFHKVPRLLKTEFLMSCNAKQETSDFFLTVVQLLTLRGEMKQWAVKWRAAGDRLKGN